MCCHLINYDRIRSNELPIQTPSEIILCAPVRRSHHMLTWIIVNSSFHNGSDRAIKEKPVRSIDRPVGPVGAGSWSFFPVAIDLHHYSCARGPGEGGDAKIASKIPKPLISVGPYLCQCAERERERHEVDHQKLSLSTATAT